MGATDELVLFAELGAAFAGFIAIFLIFARREGRFSAADSLRIRSIILTWGLFAIAAILLVSNAFWLVSPAAAWPYLASLVCILGIAASNFVTIAFQRLL